MKSEENSLEVASCNLKMREENLERKAFKIDAEINLDQNKEYVVRHQKTIPERIPAFGLLMALLSVFCLSIGSVIIKVLTQMHSIQVLVIRCIFQLTVYTTITLIYKYPICGESGHRWDLALRCISGAITQMTISMAYRLMPLGDASTIHFSSLVFVTILAYFLLKEPITILQILTGSIALIGVVIIAKPEFLFGIEDESVHKNRLLGSLWASIAAISHAYCFINLRNLKTTPVPVIAMWYSATVIVAGSIILIAFNKIIVPTGVWTWTLLVGIGLTGTSDQLFLTLALKYESAGPVSITQTFMIVFSFIWEVVLLSGSIQWMSVLGAFLIISCVIILGLLKWKTESPKQFNKIVIKIFCNFCRRTEKSEANLKMTHNLIETTVGNNDPTIVQIKSINYHHYNHHN